MSKGGGGGGAGIPVDKVFSLFTRWPICDEVRVVDGSRTVVFARINPGLLRLSGLLALDGSSLGSSSRASSRLEATSEYKINNWRDV